MSKVNVLNIRKDTREDLQNSYLGRECGFVNDEYQCHFTRNQSSSNNNWFTDVRGTKIG